MLQPACYNAFRKIFFFFVVMQIVDSCLAVLNSFLMLPVQHKIIRVVKIPRAFIFLRIHGTKVI